MKFFRTDLTYLGKMVCTHKLTKLPCAEIVKHTRNRLVYSEERYDPGSWSVPNFEKDDKNAFSFVLYPLFRSH